MEYDSRLVYNKDLEACTRKLYASRLDLYTIVGLNTGLQAYSG
jgi:hypothetical protein